MYRQAQRQTIYNIVDLKGRNPQLKTAVIKMDLEAVPLILKQAIINRQLQLWQGFRSPECPAHTSDNVCFLSCDGKLYCNTCFYMCQQQAGIIFTLGAHQVLWFQFQQKQAIIAKLRCMSVVCKNHRHVSYDGRQCFLTPIACQRSARHNIHKTCSYNKVIICINSFLQYFECELEHLFGIKCPFNTVQRNNCLGSGWCLNLGLLEHYRFFKCNLLNVPQQQEEQKEEEEEEQEEEEQEEEEEEEQEEEEQEQQEEVIQQQRQKQRQQRRQKQKPKQKHQQKQSHVLKNFTKRMKQQTKKQLKINDAFEQQKSKKGIKSFFTSTLQTAKGFFCERPKPKPNPIQEIDLSSQNSSTFNNNAQYIQNKQQSSQRINISISPEYFQKNTSQPRKRKIIKKEDFKPPVNLRDQFTNYQEHTQPHQPHQHHQENSKLFLSDNSDQHKSIEKVNIFQDKKILQSDKSKSSITPNTEDLQIIFETQPGKVIKKVTKKVTKEVTKQASKAAKNPPVYQKKSKPKTKKQQTRFSKRIKKLTKKKKQDEKEILKLKTKKAKLTQQLKSLKQKKKKQQKK